METPKSSTAEMYNLRWNSYHLNLTNIFAELQSQESLVDVTLSCEGEFIKVHRLVLSACSHYFQKMFQIYTTAPQLVILLNNVQLKYLRMIIHFMYNGEVKVAYEDLPTFLSLGKTLQVKGLCNIQNSIPLQKEAKQTEEQNSPEAPPKKKRRVSLKSTNGNQSSCEKSKTSTVPSPSSSNIIKSPPTLEIRPPNAFMIFADQWRKRLAVEHPEDSPKAISLKLSNMWKSLSQDTKDGFYEEARSLERQLKSSYCQEKNSDQVTHINLADSPEQQMMDVKEEEARHSD